MRHIVSPIKNIRTIKAIRGDSLTIDLGETYNGTLTAWMKRQPDAENYRSFEIRKNRYLYLSKEKASDYRDKATGKILEDVEGKWYFDVEFIPQGESVEDSKTIYTGTILFFNDVTNSGGTEILESSTSHRIPNVRPSVIQPSVIQPSLPTQPQITTFIGLSDTPNTWGNIGQVPAINRSGNGLEWINLRPPFSGNYNDLTNKPTLFDGDYNSLSNKPNIPKIQTVEKISYSDLDIKKKSGTLIPEKEYFITDFRTIYKQRYTNILSNSNKGMLQGLKTSRERLVVKAKTNNSFYRQARSLDFVDDIIVYLFDSETIDTTKTKGRIIYRKDTVLNVATLYDFRAIKFRRYALKANEIADSSRIVIGTIGRFKSGVSYTSTDKHEEKFSIEVANTDSVIDTSDSANRIKYFQTISLPKYSATGFGGNTFLERGDENDFIDCYTFCFLDDLDNNTLYKDESSAGDFKNINITEPFGKHDINTDFANGVVLLEYGGNINGAFVNSTIYNGKNVRIKTSCENCLFSQCKGNEVNIASQSIFNTCIGLIINYSFNNYVRATATKVNYCLDSYLVSSYSNFTHFEKSGVKNVLSSNINNCKNFNAYNFLTGCNINRLENIYFENFVRGFTCQSSLKNIKFQNIVADVVIVPFIEPSVLKTIANLPAKTYITGHYLSTGLNKIFATAYDQNGRQSTIGYNLL